MRLVWPLVLGWCLAGRPASGSGPEPVTFDVLTIGPTSYRDVRVTSRDERSVFFTFRGGIGSARLRSLPPEAQARLGFDPSAAPPEPPHPASAPPAFATKPPLPEQVVGARRRLDRLFLAYGTPARVAGRQSLRDDFTRLNLAVKDQGRRPSCSIYAIVGALEFQYFQAHGRAEHFSEEYLIWATRRSLGLSGLDGLPARDAQGRPLADAGYSLPSVIGAVSTYGLALEKEMPERRGPAAHTPAVPPPWLVEQSHSRRSAFIAAVPGRTPQTLLNNLIHALNAGFPVPAGLAWPSHREAASGLLDRQQPLPNAAHAITFVGYECPSSHPEDAVFVFKNSYGPDWGENGYGRATWRYLAANLRDAYVIDVSVLGP